MVVARTLNYSLVVSFCDNYLVSRLVCHLPIPLKCDVTCEQPPNEESPSSLETIQALVWFDLSPKLISVVVITPADKLNNLSSLTLPFSDLKNNNFTR